MRSIASPCRIALLALVLLAPAAAPMPAFAREASTAEASADPYEDFYAAMDEVLGGDAASEEFLQMMREELRNDPVYGPAERRNPGLIAATVNAMAPWYEKHWERLDRRYKPRSIAIMRDELSPEDARKLAAYSRTERGKKLLLARMGSDARAGTARPAGPRQPLGQPTAFLKPAEGAPPPPPPKPKPAAAPKPADQPQDPAITAVTGDPELQAKAARVFDRMDGVALELVALPLDRDIMAGLEKAADDAATIFGLRAWKDGY